MLLTVDGDSEKYRTGPPSPPSVSGNATYRSQPEHAIIGTVKTMGFNVGLQDELGGRIDGVDDPKGLLNRLLPGAADRDDFPFLRSIDDYGDTTFNRLQRKDYPLAHGSRRRSSADERSTRRQHNHCGGVLRAPLGGKERDGDSVTFQIPRGSMGVFPPLPKAHPLTR